MDEYIREYTTQKIIGVLRTNFNGDITAYAYPSYKALAIWKKDINVTYELPSYKGVSTGNTVVSFIYRK